MIEAYLNTIWTDRMTRGAFLLLLLPLGLYAQKPDSTRHNQNQGLNLLLNDTTTANIEDKYILSELDKVQYVKYSENLKNETLRKVLENQRLQTASLQQKLLNEQLKAEANRKQVEANRRQELQKQQIKQFEINQLSQKVILQNRTRNFLFAGVGLLTLLGLLLFWSNWQLKKRNQAIHNLSAENIIKEQEKQQILATQNETLERQVTERTAVLNHSLDNLKTTQNQLIQKEKLASLGELTAGIAHEIQNPLNFVNNFSEFSVGIAEELKDEIKKPEKDWGLIEELMDDLIANQTKINHHGKRASNIVKGMLEHSKTGTGERQLTDINKLADEYLRLSYQSMKAKNKDFVADYQLLADETSPKINVIPQEIGRVLLNLLNNAFYAVSQKRDLTTLEELSNLGVPTVTVTTKALENTIEITVKDNGNGIPKANLEKIFQPFFTTKPTGEGSTGLGLSLSYDIVTKGHGGTLEVVSLEGEGTEFIMRLPTV